MPLGWVIPPGLLTHVSDFIKKVTGIGDLDKLACGEDEFCLFDLLAVMEVGFEVGSEENPVVCPVGWVTSIHVIKGGLFPELGLSFYELEGEPDLFLIGHVWGECKVVFA